MFNDEVDAAVGMTRKWDAREAGRDVARNTIKNLKTPPSFVILFSTIHYKDHGGFEEFLKGVWDVIPKGTPLVGGTVLGFVNNKGCYTRGASALAVSYPNMDVQVGLGKNTKRNPVKAGIKSANMIKKGLSNSKYKHKFLFNFVSGPGAIKIPGQGYKKVIDSGFISKFITFAFGISQYVLQKGFGREDEVFEQISKTLPDYKMILGTSMDDYKTGLCNYQFFNEEVHSNVVVNLGLSADINLDVNTTHGMKRTDINFEITKLSRNKHIIYKINNKSAVKELYRILNWPNGFLNEKTMGHTILYYPISLKRHGKEVPVVMPYFLKNSIMTPCIIDKGKVSIMTVSGQNFKDALKENLYYFDKTNISFGLFSACMTILVTLGNRVYDIREEIIDFFDEKPFLMFFSAGEGTYSNENKFTYANMSFNTAIFGTDKK
jgi:hypothetical protein